VKGRKEARICIAIASQKEIFPAENLQQIAKFIATADQPKSPASN